MSSGTEEPPAGNQGHVRAGVPCAGLSQTANMWCGHWSSLPRSLDRKPSTVPLRTHQSRPFSFRPRGGKLSGQLALLKAVNGQTSRAPPPKARDSRGRWFPRKRARCTVTTHVPQLKVDQLLGRPLLLEQVLKHTADRPPDACCSEVKETLCSRKQITHQLDSLDFSPNQNNKSLRD